MKNKDKHVKLCFIDLETTGTDPIVNGVHWISGKIFDVTEDGLLFPSSQLIEIDKFDLRVRPFAADVVSGDAIEVSKTTFTQLEEFLEPGAVKQTLEMIFAKHVDKFDKFDKMFFVGYNARFDCDFMREFWRKTGDKYFGSWFWFPPIDVMNMAVLQLINKRCSMPDFKLGTVAETLGVKLDKKQLHSALVDIDLTIALYLTLINKEKT